MLNNPEIINNIRMFKNMTVNKALANGYNVISLSKKINDKNEIRLKKYTVVKFNNRHYVLQDEN